MRQRAEPAPALVLFDIDGTLVRRAGPHHRQALVDAIRRVAGIDTTTDHIPLQGMLDPDILTCMMRNQGVPAQTIRRALPSIIQCAQQLYVRSCPDLQDRTCPGVIPLLSALETLGVPMGLVTGNLSRIGWKKLERCGLKRFFGFGAFGEMTATRTGLVGIALRDARKQGWIRRGTPATLVGDAPADIIAAKANRVRSVAVLTGVSSRQELATCGPDLLLEDLSLLRPEDLLASGSR